MPDGSVRKVAKFAPMGSAVCFPVQCIIFATVCIVATILHYTCLDDLDGAMAIINGDLSRWLARHVSADFGQCSRTYESIAVYGDDIIVDNRITTIVVDILRKLGFVVNETKSFFGDQAFRESCGVFSLAGEDVTPFAFKARYIGSEVDTRALASLVSLANLAGDYGYRHTQKFLIHFALEWNPPRGCSVNPIRFTADRNAVMSFYSSRPRNSHLKQRENSDLQREEVRAWTVSPRERVRPIDVGYVYSWDASNAYEEYALSLFYRAAALGRGSDSSYVTPRAVLLGAKLRWIWTPP
jgi:hypothetical protein